LGAISLIVFDLGKVIVDFSHFEIAAALAEKSTLSRYQDPAVLLSSLFGPGEVLNRSFDEGRLSAEEFYRAACKKFHLDLDYAEFVLRWNRSFKANREVMALIDELTRRYRLFLLSNTNPLHYAHVAKILPVLQKMEERILSYEVGFLKPSPLIYQAVLQRAGLPPQEVLYIDDVQEFVSAASWLGIQGIVFQSFAALEAELKRRGVL